MSYGGIFDYDAKAERLRTVNASLEDPTVWNDSKRAQELGREKKTLDTVVVTLDNLTSELADNTELYDMSKEDGDEAGLLYGQEGGGIGQLGQLGHRGFDLDPGRAEVVQATGRRSELVAGEEDHVAGKQLGPGGGAKHGVPLLSHAPSAERRAFVVAESLPPSRRLQVRPGVRDADGTSEAWP